jgi:EAL domain-containing protein (putative c-di-GMP-specific phosphodiesterase class I)
MIEGNIILRALEDMSLLRRTGYGVPNISFNVSAQFLKQPNMADLLANICEMNGFAPREIILEVSEKGLSSEAGDASTKALLDAVDAGFGIVIDDFGIGFSSMLSMARLELSGIKLDRALVDKFADRDTEKVLMATIGMAKGMNVSIAAVGIENEAQFQSLKSMGCTAGQGKLILAPSDVEGITSWLDARNAPEIQQLFPGATRL